MKKKIFHDDLGFATSFAWVPRYKRYEQKNTVPRCVGFFAKDRLEELVDHDRKNLEQRQQT